jgi:hypothetical protein
MGKHTTDAVCNIKKLHIDKQIIALNLIIQCLEEKHLYLQTKPNMTGTKLNSGQVAQDPSNFIWTLENFQTVAQLAT